MARICNFLLQEVQDIWRSPSTGDKKQLGGTKFSGSIPPVWGREQQGTRCCSQTSRWNSRTWPWAGHPECRARSWSNSEAAFSHNYSLDITGGSLQLPGELRLADTVSEHIPWPLSPLGTPQPVGSLAQAGSSIMAAKRWHAGRFHCVTSDLPSLPNRLFLSPGPNKMHYLAGICCSAASTNLSSTNFIWRSSTLI